MHGKMTSNPQGNYYEVYARYEYMHIHDETNTVSRKEIPQHSKQWRRNIDHYAC